jgi:hypothetical protein
MFNRLYVIHLFAIDVQYIYIYVCMHMHIYLHISTKCAFNQNTSLVIYSVCIYLFHPSIFYLRIFILIFSVFLIF